LTPTRAMAPLTSKLWQVWHSVTISDLWSHHCEWSKKNSHHSFSVDFQGLPEKFLLNHVLRSHKKHDEVLHPA
jgi:hypothetical protein